MPKNIIFKDYPDFTPNLTPQQIFEYGSFGGTYWRPIYSNITNKKYKNIHHKYPNSFKNIDESYLSSDTCDISKNKYKVKVGTSLQFWENKNWITKYHVYGWVHWYCDFYMGSRCPDDARQIKRWIQTAGPKSRFRRALINLINKKNTSYNDFSISPKRRQTLQHWGYILTDNDLYN